MITIFCDFRQFSAKKLAFFSITNVMIKVLHNIAFLSQKRQLFRWIFRRKYFKNHNIGPWSHRGQFTWKSHFVSKLWAPCAIKYCVLVNFSLATVSFSNLTETKKKNCRKSFFFFSYFSRDRKILIWRWHKKLSRLQSNFFWCRFMWLVTMQSLAVGGSSSRNIGFSLHTGISESAQ
jgi:hypothetical protein